MTDLPARLKAAVPLLTLTLIAACSPDRPLGVTYVANEGVLLATGSHRILIDALFDAPNPAYASPPPELLQRLIGAEPPVGHVDLCLVTHNHPDHFRASVVDRFLVGQPRALLIAPVDVVEVLRDSAAHWTEYEDRVVPIDLRVGERATHFHAGIRVHAFRTLHSGGRESPMNLMYLVEMDGSTVFHEGDSNGDLELFRAVVGDGTTIDLALVHYWFPFVDVGTQILNDILRPTHVGLIHLPVDDERFPAERFANLDDRFKLFAEPSAVWELRAEGGR